MLVTEGRRAGLVAVAAATVLGVLGGIAPLATAAPAVQPAVASAAPTATLDPARLPVDASLQPAHVSGRTIYHGSLRVTLSSAWSRLDLVAVSSSGYVLSATYGQETRRRLVVVSKGGAVTTITPYAADVARNRLGYAIASPGGDKVAIFLDKPDRTRSVWIVGVAAREVLGTFATAADEFPMAISDTARVLMTNETVSGGPARTWWRSRTGTETEVAAVDVVRADLRTGLLATVEYQDGGGYCEQLVRIDAPTTPVWAPTCGSAWTHVESVSPTGAYVHTRNRAAEATQVDLREADGTTVKSYRATGDGYLGAEPWFTSTRQVIRVEATTGPGTGAYLACQVVGSCVRLSVLGAQGWDFPDTTGRTDMGSEPASPATGHL